MFEAIRRNQRILQGLLVLLIFPAFAFFGISGYDRFLADDDAVATVADTAISAQEFEAARLAQVENMRRFLGDQLDPAMLNTPTARAEILEGLIAQRVLAVETSNNRVSVPDVAIQNAIRAIPDFQNEQGQFDIDRYRTLIVANGNSELAFESRIRADLAMKLIPQSISDGTIVPKAVGKRIVALQGQTRQYRSKKFDPASYVQGVTLEDGAAKSFYDESTNDFMSPETAKVNYLVLSADVLAKELVVDEAQLRAFYDENKAKYVQTEQRSASHILLTLDSDASEDKKREINDKARSLVDKLRAGADFAELAKKESQDPGSANNGGDLGSFDRNTMVKPFADAAFKMSANDISDVVESEFGLHIIKLTGIEPETQQNFNKVKAEIESQLRAQQARQKFLESAESFSNIVYEQPDSLAPAADKLGLRIATIDDLRRHGGPDLEANSVLRNPKVLRAVFSKESIKEKSNTEAIDLGNNVLISARIVDHRESKRLPFEAVEAEAIAKLRLKEAARLATEAGKAELAKLKAGATPDGFGEEKSATRQGSELPLEAAKALFAHPKGRVPDFVGTGLAAGGYMIQELISVKTPDEEALKKSLVAYQAQGTATAGGSAFESYLEALKARMEITRKAPAPAEADS